jgi:regulatory protein YycI of two-component signal transduction system YycFG
MQIIIFLFIPLLLVLSFAQKNKTDPVIGVNKETMDVAIR